ncbi:MAG: NUDIX domain-containing protein [Patescibacteria group bacterium]
MKEDKLFYVAQKAFIQKGGDVLILNDPIIGLDLPGGKIQEDEYNFTEALKREVREETGLEIEIGEPFYTWYFKFKPGHRNYPKEVYLIGFRCRWISGEVQLSDEHDSFRWVNENNYNEVDDSSEYFKALKKYFTHTK